MVDALRYATGLANVRQAIGPEFGVHLAGVVLGQRVTIILTSRANGARTRLTSCAVTALSADGQRRGMAMLKSSE